LKRGKTRKVKEKRVKEDMGNITEKKKSRQGKSPREKGGWRTSAIQTVGKKLVREPLKSVFKKGKKGSGRQEVFNYGSSTTTLGRGDMGGKKTARRESNTVRS